MSLTPQESTARDYLGRLGNWARKSAAEQSLTAAIEANTQEAYRWARIDRRTQHFQPPARSGDASIYESHDLMHRRTRSEALNNAQIKRVVDALTDLVIGSGIQTFADPFEPWQDFTTVSNGDFDELLSYALESDEIYEEWFSDPRQFDVAGKMSGAEMYRLAFSENVQVGDALLLECSSSEPGRIVPLCFQLIEREQLDTSRDRPASQGQNKIVNGIELDAKGREVAFYIYDTHPYDDFGQGASYGSSSRIRAERVTHLFAFTRPSQSLGVSWLHALGQTSFDRDKLVGNHLQRAAKAALLLLVAKFKNLKNAGSLGLDDGDSSSDEFGNEEIKLGSVPIAAKITSEDDVELIESEGPGAALGDFVSVLDHDTAGGCGLSYYTLTGRYEDTNFSSLRGALVSEDTHIKPLQNWFARSCALPIRRKFNRQAVALGKLSTITAAEFLAQERKFQRIEAVGPGRDLLDPEAEGNAASGRIRSGMSTLKIECARRGLHWIRVLRQRAMENRIASQLQVVLDFSKGQGGQVDKTTSDAQGKQGAAK